MVGPIAGGAIMEVRMRLCVRFLSSESFYDFLTGQISVDISADVKKTLRDQPSVHMVLVPEWGAGVPFRREALRLAGRQHSCIVKFV